MAKEVQESQELDRNALTLQAFQERMAQLVVEYESKVAELRVEYTIAMQSIEQLTNKIQELEGDAVPKQASPTV